MGYCNTRVSVHLHTALKATQSRKAVTAYFSSEQLLPFGLQRILRYTHHARGYGRFRTFLYLPRARPRMTPLSARSIDSWRYNKAAQATCAPTAGK